MSSFCRGASKVILNDSPFNFGRYMQNRASYRTILYILNWMCFLWGYSMRLLKKIKFTLCNFI